MFSIIIIIFSKDEQIKIKRLIEKIRWKLSDINSTYTSREKLPLNPNPFKFFFLEPFI